MNLIMINKVSVVLSIIVIASHLQSNSVSVDVNGSLDFFFFFESEG